jgi:TFIIF, beta subunit HTH domain/TFIIF, beta subunit N-terminus
MASRGNHDDDDHVNHKNGDDDDEDEGGEEERVTAHSYGALDGTPGTSSNSNNDNDLVQVSEECWLVRIPQALALAWEEAPEGTNLGDLNFKKGGPVPGPGNKKINPSFTIHVSEELVQQQQRQRQQQSLPAAKKPAAAATTNTATASTLPLNYSLQAMTKKVPVMHPFTRNPRNGRVQLLGTVSRTANLQVEQDQTYRALCKDRMVATNLTASRFVKPVESTESVMSKKQQQQPQQMVASAAASAAAGIPGGADGGNSRKRKTFGDAVFHFGKRMLDAAEKSLQQQRNQLLLQQQAAITSKKARQFSPDQSLRSVLFELFQQNPYWAVKDLKAAASAGGATHAGTKKGESEIRDILREIGEYHRSGDHKNMWELRTEFQQQS